ncbi:MAG: Ku protein [Proteobacteria bacterium]|nr:MAG: Ku protein [Pseudomonadota bacterium]
MAATKKPRAKSAAKKAPAKKAAAKKAKAEPKKPEKKGRPGGIWKGSVSFGLLNIPIVLQSADEEKDLHFTQLDPSNMAPIKMKRTNSKTGKEVTYSSIVKGYNTGSGKYVIVTDKDFKAANPKATQTMDLEDFVPLADLDTMLFQKPYYVVPQKNGEKGYFLLRDALEASKKIAIGKIVLRTKQHLAALMPKGKYLVLELLRFSSEVLEEHEVSYLDGIKEPGYLPRELKMAEQLVEEMTSKWNPDQYKDTYHDELLKRIRAKEKNGDIEDAPEPEVEEEGNGKVVDLLPLLQKSLSAGKKKTG